MGKVSALSLSLAPRPHSPDTYGGQVVPGPGPPAAPVLSQLLQGRHGGHLGLDLSHV